MEGRKNLVKIRRRHLGMPTLLLGSPLIKNSTVRTMEQSTTLWAIKLKGEDRANSRNVLLHQQGPNRMWPMKF